ncbi:unnamed protein product, partial [Adineta ricciae]
VANKHRYREKRSATQPVCRYSSDVKALVYYITDYITKSSLAFYDMFVFAQQGIKSIEQYRNPDRTESAVEKSRKLVLRCYNMIASRQEVSGVQVPSYLMDFGDHYTTHTFKNLFLFSIENYLQTELIKARLNTKEPDERTTEGMLRDFYEDPEEDGTKMNDEQFVLEKIANKNENTYVMVNTRLDYQCRSKDLSTVRLYDFNAQSSHGEHLSTEGTRMNERHSFESTHPQSASHIFIRHNNPVVPVLLGPQIPRREREDTRERYCRTILTLFAPWRSINDLCTVTQTDCISLVDNIVCRRTLSRQVFIDRFFVDIT